MYLSSSAHARMQIKQPTGNFVIRNTYGHFSLCNSWCVHLTMTLGNGFLRLLSYIRDDGVRRWLASPLTSGNKGEADPPEDENSDPGNFVSPNKRSRIITPAHKVSTELAMLLGCQILHHVAGASDCKAACYYSVFLFGAHLQVTC